MIIRPPRKTRNKIKENQNLTEIRLKYMQTSRVCTSINRPIERGFEAPLNKRPINNIKKLNIVAATITL